LTRLSFFAGPYIMNTAVKNATNCPGVRLPAEICRTPYHKASAMPIPPSSSINGGRVAIDAVTFMFVRNSR
jgi:hypothetical protein